MKHRDLVYNRLKYLAVMVFIFTIIQPQTISTWILTAVITTAVMTAPRVKRKWGVRYNGLNITLGNGGLNGTIQTDDGIVGLVMTGVSEAGGYTLGTPILVTGMSSVATAGITAANNPYAIRHLQELYNEAGDGAQVYLMLVSSATTVAAMALNSNANGVVKLLNYAAGEIKVVGLLADDKAIHTAGGTITIINGMNADCYTAATNLQTTLNGYTAAKQPLRGIIGCTSYAGVPANLTNMTTGSNNRVAFMIGDTQIYDNTYTSAAVGLILGRIAASSVQTKISKVRAGALSSASCYIGTTPITCTTADITTVSGKGFITFIAYARKSGFFFAGDPMLTATTDDYSALARCRVIDKAYVLAYLTYLEEVDDDLPVNDDGSGTLDPNYIAWLQNLILTQISNTMLANKEISGVDCYIDPAQDVVATSVLNIVLKIRPKAYADDIEILLGFEQ